MPDVEPESHTYMAHFMFRARDDEHARQIAEAFKDAIESWHEFVERDLPEDEQVTIQPNGYVVEAAHLTDADDWAEHVPAEDVCEVCGGGGTNRTRMGTGSRWCAACADGGPVYPIVDEEI